jgi:galactose mutarotase-like enzyme
MFAIVIEQKQYETYILTDQSAQTHLEVVPERGGIITRWQVRGEDLLYMDQERFANPELSVRGGIPILFPICGNLPDNTYTHKGQTYKLKQHGFARDLSWQVAESMTREGVGITLTLTDNPQTQAVYPFKFDLSFTYRLRENSLLIQQCFTNRSPEPMPFSTGLHPYFRVSDKTRLQFDIPATEFQNQQDQITHPFAGSFDFGQDEIDVAFRSLSGQSAQVIDHRRRLELTLEYDSIYSTLVFWTLKDKDYYCLEPWTAPRNALNTGEHLTHLDPGARVETLVTMTVNTLL